MHKTSMKSGFGREGTSEPYLGPVVVEPGGGREVDEGRRSEQARLVTGLEVQRQRAALRIAVVHLLSQPAAAGCMIGIRTGHSFRVSARVRVGVRL